MKSLIILKNKHFSNFLLDIEKSCRNFKPINFKREDDLFNRVWKVIVKMLRVLKEWNDFNKKLFEAIFKYKNIKLKFLETF